MYFRLMGKLNARRNGLLAEDEKGFTLIELLVVVIIIGILAAIAIPVYLKVQDNAKSSAVQTDVTNLKTAVVSLETNNGALPVAFTGASAPAGLSTTDANSGAITASDWTGAGVTFSKYTATLKLTESGNNFCVEADKKNSTDKFAATDSDGVQKGSCNADGTVTAG